MSAERILESPTLGAMRFGLEEALDRLIMLVVPFAGRCLVNLYPVFGILDCVFCILYSVLRIVYYLVTMGLWDCGGIEQAFLCLGLSLGICSLFSVSFCYLQRRMVPLPLVPIPCTSM